MDGPFLKLAFESGGKKGWLFSESRNPGSIATASERAYACRKPGPVSLREHTWLIQAAINGYAMQFVQDCSGRCKYHRVRPHRVASDHSNFSAICMHDGLYFEIDVGREEQFAEGIEPRN